MSIYIIHIRVVLMYLNSIRIFHYLILSTALYLHNVLADKRVKRVGGIVTFIYSEGIESEISRHT